MKNIKGVLFIFIIFSLFFVSNKNVISNANAEKAFTVTRKLMNDATAVEESVGEFDTLNDAFSNLDVNSKNYMYTVTVNKDVETENKVMLNNVNVILKSKGNNKFTLTNVNTIPGTFISTTSSPDVAYVSVNITIKNLILNGNNKGGCLFLPENNHAILENVTLKNFQSVQNCDGPCIYLTGNGKLTAKNVTFEDNISNLEHGGVIYANNTDSNKDTEIDIDGAVFKNNKAIGEKKNKFGGAIFSTGKLNIKNATFENNVSPFGGAIAFYGGQANIDSCKFINNKSKNGGAINIGKKSTINIKNCEFNKNEANFGGAILSRLNVNIENTSFIENKAIVSGGAIFAHKEGTVTIKNSKFIKNSSKNGGAIFDQKIDDEQTMYSNLSTDKKTIFKENVATNGLYIPPKDYIKYTNLLFDKENSDVSHGNEIESLLNNYDVNYKSNTRIIKYDANGGKFDNGKSTLSFYQNINDKVKIHKAPQFSGYKFSHWEAEGKNYNPDDEYTVTQNIIFKAIWIKAPEPQPKPPVPPTPPMPNPNPNPHPNFKKIKVDFRFESESKDKLPKEVLNLLPKSYVVDEGADVVVNPKIFKNILTKNGVWKFEKWDKEKVEKAKDDITFTGFWKFTKNNEEIKENKQNLPKTNITSASLSIFLISGLALLYTKRNK